MNKSYSIDGATVEEVWAKAFLSLMRPGLSELTPLYATVHEIAESEPENTPPIRKALDQILMSHAKGKDKAKSMATTSTVANTIFPQSLWNPARERTLLYRRYMDYVFPTIKPDNPRGTYFQRMVAFGSGDPPINQLESIISTWTEHSNHRHSALQISIFDPAHDHKNSKQLGFPCLHQICFTPHGEGGSEGLSVTAFYATQHIVPKGYGNYLGLIRLGKFVAAALGLQLVRMTCIAAKAKLGDGMTKQELQGLQKICEGYFPDATA